MSRIPSRLTRLVGATALAGAMAFAGTGSAWASSNPTVTLSAGSLTLTPPTAPNFAGVTLNGAPQSTTATIPAYSVDDATGSGAGWNVTVGATQFCEQSVVTGVAPGTCATGGKVLPTGSLSVAAPTASAANASSGGLPTMSALTGIDGGASAKQASAAAGAGMGTFNLSSAVATLSIPANAYAKTYVSTVTYSIVTGP